MRDDLAVPRYFAIAPYDVTRPAGMSRTTAYTDSKKSLFRSLSVSIIHFKVSEIVFGNRISIKDVLIDLNLINDKQVG
jgi:hypothetical protein